MGQGPAWGGGILGQSDEEELQELCVKGVRIVPHRDQRRPRADGFTAAA